MTTTNIGPLTTIFTPPASCLSTVTSEVTNGFYVGHFGAGGSGCYPPGTRQNIFATSYLYSPGICPSGYSYACSWPTNIFSAFPAETTASMCCPSGFQCYQGGGVNYGQVCVSNVVGTSLTNLWLAPDDYPETTPGSLSLTSTTAPQVILNNGIPVMWQSTDSQILLLLASRSSSLAGVVLTSQPISTSSISSSSSTTTPSATNSTSTLPSSSSIPSESAAAKSTGLSSGAKAGIGVGAGVGALLLLAFLFLLVRRYRKQATLREKQSLSATREAGPSRLEFKHELSGHGYVHDKDQEKKVYEAQSNPLSELSTTKQHTVGELE